MNDDEEKENGCDLSEVANGLEEIAEELNYNEDNNHHTWG